MAIGANVKETIVVWFSCGAASAVAAKKTIELYGNTHIIRVVNSFIAEEDADNQRFLNDIEKWLGIKIESAINPRYESGSAAEVWEKRKFMFGPKGAPCTLELKKEARYYWEKNNKADHHVLGFTFDEVDRHNNFTLSERQLLPVLISLRITKGDCFKILKDAGIELPRIYSLGFPNANCIGCVKATSPTYWNLVRKTYPDVYQSRMIQSDRLGAKLVRYKGKRISLAELPIDAKGRPLKNMNYECGIFCEER